MTMFLRHNVTLSLSLRPGAGCAVKRQMAGTSYLAGEEASCAAP